MSFDAVVFLTKAAIERDRIGATRMHVIIVGEMRDKSQFYDAVEARWRLWNIVIPACQLFGATVTLAADWLQAERLASVKDWKNWPADWRNQTLKQRHHLVGDVITAARAGVKVPRVQASAHARAKVREWWSKPPLPMVTVTLRNTYIRERNSDRKQWDIARTHIIANGYAVTTIEDTSVALWRGCGYGELNLDLRAAMYQEAELNLLPSNGPASLCWFGERDYRMFGAGVPAEEWENLFVKQGLPRGESWPWAGPQQRLVYGATTAEQIIEEFDRWVGATR